MPAHRLRVLSMNLANGRVAPSALERFVEPFEPDVVAVQELTAAQASVLERRFPFGKLDPAGDCTGMGIALDRPATLWRLAMSYRDAYVAEIPVSGTGGDIEVINVHFAAPHMPPPWRTLARRRAQLRALEAHLDTRRRPRMVVGDLNSTTVWPVYRRLCARLVDAASEAARQRESRPARTWGLRPGTRRLLRIDHALVQHLSVLTVEVHPIPGSDHCALLVDVTRDAQRGEGTA